MVGTAGTNGLRIRSVTHGSSGFVAVAAGGTVLVSADAQVWNQITISSPPWYPSAAGFGDGTYVLGGGSVAASIWTSTNTVDWTWRDAPFSFSAVAYGNGVHVAVGFDSNSVTSSDGVAWRRHELGQRLLARCLGFGNGTFVAAGIFSNLFTSTDGARWTAQNAGTNLHFNGLAYGLNTFVIAGSQGVVLASKTVLIAL